MDDPEDSPPRNGRRTRKDHSDDEFDGPGAKESEADDSDANEPVDPRELQGMNSKNRVYTHQSSN